MSRMTTLLAGALAIVATVAVRRTLTAAWRKTTASDPPGDAVQHPSMAQALAWTVVSAAALAATQMLVRRGVARALERPDDGEIEARRARLRPVRSPATLRS